MQLTIIVNGNSIKVGYDKITSGAKGVPCTISFDSSWDGYSKTVVFYQDSGYRYPLFLATDKISGTIPSQALNKAKPLHVGVYGLLGTDIRVPTEVATVPILEGICDENYVVGEPSADIYSQILATLEEYHQENIARDLYEAYSAAKTYVPGNKVSYLGSSYINIVSCLNVLPTVTNNWLLIASKGDKGDMGNICNWGVVEGLEVISNNDLTFYVNNGSAYLPSGDFYTFAMPEGLSLSEPDAVYDRIDIVYISAMGFRTYLAGTAAVSPNQPALPSGGLLLAVIYVRSCLGSLLQENITDKRAIFTSLDILKTQVASAEANTLIYKNAAEASAAAASASETNAKTSETNAGTSETTTTQTMNDFLSMLGTDVATLVGGKIPISQIPATAINDVFVVSSAAELTALTAQRGDLGEIIETIDGISTVTKTYQLLGTGDPTIADNWIVWGTSYAVQAGNATTADNATNSSMINNHRIVEMTQAEYDVAVKDPDTYYIVY